MGAGEQILFLVGAGASRDAELPLAVELTEKLISDIEAHRPKFMRLIQFVYGGICFGRGCQGKKPSTPINIEEFLIACHDLSHRSHASIYPFVAAWHERISEISPL